MIKYFYYIWHIDGILTGTITLGQSGSGSNGYEEVLSSPKLQDWNLIIR